MCSSDLAGCPVSGILVLRVIDDSCADDAELKKGDIITAIEGHTLNNDGMISVDWIDTKVPFITLFEQLHVGSTIELQVWRDDEMITLTTTMPATSNSALSTTYPEQGATNYYAFDGIVMQQLHTNHLVLAVNSAGITNSQIGRAHV